MQPSLQPNSFWKPEEQYYPSNATHPWPFHSHVPPFPCLNFHVFQNEKMWWLLSGLSLDYISQSILPSMWNHDIQRDTNNTSLFINFEQQVAPVKSSLGMSATCLTCSNVDFHGNWYSGGKHTVWSSPASFMCTDQGLELHLTTFDAVSTVALAAWWGAKTGGSCSKS